MHLNETHETRTTGRRLEPVPVCGPHLVHRRSSERRTRGSGSLAGSGYRSRLTVRGRRWRRCEHDGHRALRCHTAWSIMDWTPWRGVSPYSPYAGVGVGNGCLAQLSCTQRFATWRALTQPSARARHDTRSVTPSTRPIGDVIAHSGPVTVQIDIGWVGSATVPLPFELACAQRSVYRSSCLHQMPSLCLAHARVPTAGAACVAAP